MPFLGPVLGNIALNLAIGVGVSYLASAFAPKPKPLAPQVQNVQTRRGLSFEIEVGEAVAVSAIVGVGRAAGQLIYVNEFGTDSEFVQFVIKVGHGEHDGLEAFLVDEKPMALSGSNGDARGRSVDAFTVEGTPYMWVKAYTGATGQGADGELVSQARPEGRWTAAHKMTGCAYMIVTIRYNADLYGSAVPRFGSVWRGLKLFDWRASGAVWGDHSTYVFTKNPAVIRYNFRRGIYVNGVKILGQGFSSFANDLAGYTAAANRCDESFYDPVSAKTFPIFEFGRQVSDDEEKLAVLQELDDSYCGSSFKRGGADVPLPAQQLVSVMTLTNADRVRGEPVRVDRKGAVSQKRTMWHGQFVSADASWGLAPFTPRIDSTLESVIGGRRSIALDQPYENSQERAQLRAEIALRRQFYPATRVETFTPRALVLEPGDPVTRDCEWGQMLMVVESVDPLPDRSGVRVTLTEWNNTIVPASGDTFVSLPDGPGAGPANPDRTIAVGGFGVVAYQREGGGAVHPFARASWNQITDPKVDQVMIRVWPAAGSEANDREDFFASARLQDNKVFGPLQPLTEYVAKAIPIRSDGRTTVWTNTDTFTTGAETVPAEVADNSVTFQKLAQELRNQSGYLMGSGPGTLGARIDELQERAEAAAAAALTDQTNRVETFKILKATNGANTAAIAETRRVLVEETAALAQLIDEVAVEIEENLTAGGLIRIEGEIVNEDAQANILLKVRAAVADAFSEAALQLRAQSDGLGGTISQVAIMANQLVFIDNTGAAVLVPFLIDDGEVTMNIANIGTVNAGLLQSFNGASFWNLNTGAFRIST